MPNFLFRAIRPDLSEETGEIDAVDLESAGRRLTAAGLKVLLLKPVPVATLESPPAPPGLPPLESPTGQKPNAKGFRSKWKDNQKFNAAPPLPPVPPLEPPAIPPPVSTGIEGPRAATAEQSQFRSRWRDNLKYNQDPQNIPPPPPPEDLGPPHSPVGVSEVPPEAAFNPPPLPGPPVPSVNPKPFRAKWKENLERSTAPELPALEPLALPLTPDAPENPAVVSEAVTPPSLPTEALPQAAAPPKKAFSSRWKDNLRHNKPSLVLPVDSSEPEREAAPHLDLELPVATTTPESAPVPEEPPVFAQEPHQDFLGREESSLKIDVPNTEVELKAIPEPPPAPRKSQGPEISSRRGSRPLATGRPRLSALELPPPSADPNEHTPMGAAFAGGAEELALGAPSVDVADELFSSETPSMPVTSIEFSSPVVPVSEAVSRPSVPEIAMDVSGRPEGLPEAKKTQMMDLSDVSLGPGPKARTGFSDANKTQMMDISDLPLGPGPKSKTTSGEPNKTQMMNVSDLPLGPGPKGKSTLSDANKTQMMDLSELALGAGPRPKSKSGSVSIEKPKSALDVALESTELPAIEARSRKLKVERADEPQMKKILVRCFLFCVMLELMFLLVSRRTLSVEGAYKFAGSQTDAVNISFVLDNEMVIEAPEKALQSTQAGTSTKYFVDVPYYKLFAPKEVKVRIEVKASIPYTVDSIPIKAEKGHMTMPMMSLENRGRASSIGNKGL